MAVDWWVRGEGKILGPYTVAQLKQQTQAGAILAETPIRKGADGIWVRADQIRGLLGAASASGIGARKLVSESEALVPAGEATAANDVSFIGADLETGEEAAAETEAADAANLPADFPDPENTALGRRTAPQVKKKSSGLGLKLALGSLGGLILFGGIVALTLFLSGQPIEKQLQTMAAEDSQQLKQKPRTIEGGTLVEITAGPGKKLTWKCKVDDKVLNPDSPELQAKMKSEVRDDLAKRKLTEAGVTVTVEYYDATEAKVFSFDVKPTGDAKP